MVSRCWGNKILRIETERTRQCSDGKLLQCCWSCNLLKRNRAKINASSFEPSVFKVSRLFQCFWIEKRDKQASEDTFLLENAINCSMWKYWKIFFTIESNTMDSKIKVYLKSLQQSWKTWWILFNSEYWKFYIRFHFTLQSSINWQKKVVWQVSRGNHKEEVSFFKFVIDLAMKKIIQYF